MQRENVLQVHNADDVIDRSRIYRQTEKPFSFMVRRMASMLLFISLPRYQCGDHDLADHRVGELKYAVDKVFL